MPGLVRLMMTPLRVLAILFLSWAVLTAGAIHEVAILTAEALR